MPWVDDANAALLTDLYELTMAASYHSQGFEEQATFDLFVRSLPPERNFLVACGLEHALTYLERLRFDDDALRYLASLGMFDDSFLDRLRDLRFSGDVWAIPEGELAFPDEPLLRVTAPIIEAQIVETFLLNCVGYQTMVASKAARIALACGDHEFVDFSPRRDHGADAALKAARAAYVGGASGTSLVLGGQMYGIPVSGTMAHSYVMRFDREEDAFRAFAHDFPDTAVLLIDTYDTEEGARKVVELARELRDEGVAIRAVRLDSGDLAALSRSVRKILDEGGCTGIRIFASGDLDEYKIADLMEQDAPIDAFGVGTQLGTSGDAPSLSIVYKLAEAAAPRMKLSEGKVTLPGRKQVHRVRTPGGALEYDVIALEDEVLAGAEPVLLPVMTDGAPTGSAPSIDELGKRCRDALSRLPPPLRSLQRAPEPYRVEWSPQLTALVDRMTREHRAH